MTTTTTTTTTTTSAPRVGTAPIWTSDVADPVFSGTSGLPAVRLLAIGVDAVLQVVAIGPQECMMAVFDATTGDPHAVFRMQHPDPQRNMAHLMAKALAGFSEPERCLDTARIAVRFPSAHWAEAAERLLHGHEPMPALGDTLQLFPGLLDAETGLPRTECVARIVLDSIVEFVPAAAEGAQA